MPLQSGEAEATSGQRREHLEQAAHFVRPDGAVFAAAAAARELFAYLPLGWAPRNMLRIPGAMWVAAKVYRWSARRYGPVR